MKKILATITVILSIGLAGGIGDDQITDERINAIPDSVFEYITLKGDFNEYEIINYYDTHRMKCDSVEIANL